MASKIEIYSDVTLTSGKELEVVALAAVIELLPKNVDFSYSSDGSKRNVVFTSQKSLASSSLQFDVNNNDCEDLREFHSRMCERTYQAMVRLAEKSGKMCGKESQLFRAKPVRGKK